MNARSISHRDSGSVLILVLVFITVIGAVTVALLRQAQTNLIASTLTRNQEKRVYAADAGIDYAIQMLRSDPTLCTAARPLPNPPAINGRAVTMTCQVTAGSAVGAGGWAIFLTSPPTCTPKCTISTQGAANGNKTVSGPIFNRGGWDLKAALQVKNGNVYQYPASGCAKPSNLTFPSTTPGLYGFVCTNTNPYPAGLGWPPPLQPLPAAIPSDAPSFTDSGGCRTFYPGRYSTVPALGDGTNYFRSGVYFFDDIGKWSVDGGVLGGQPAPIVGQPGSTETHDTSTTPCGTDVAGATGVEWILGGSSAISVGNQSQLELYSMPSNNVPGVGLYQVLASDPAPWAAERSTVPVDTPILVVGNGNQTELAIHGNVYTPTGYVQVRATNASRAELQGGVVAAQVDIRASAGISNLNIATNSGPGQRTIVVTATSGGSGEKPITASAVLTIGNDANKTLMVVSWRLINV